MSPPFIKSSARGNCFQAVLKMILMHFEPNVSFTCEELREITGQQPGKWTWPQKTLIELHGRGYDVLDIDLFDPKEFIARGAEYLLEFYGQEVGQEQIDYTDIPYEQEMQRQCLRLGVQQQRMPTFVDIQCLLEQGFLVVCHVDVKKLIGKSGEHSSHTVLVYRCQENRVSFHNPGPSSAEEAGQRSYKDFEEAWAFAGKYTSLQAFRKQRSAG